MDSMSESNTISVLFVNQKKMISVLFSMLNLCLALMVKYVFPCFATTITGIVD